MNRTIKFRVWNGKRMLYPDYFGSDAYGSQGQITIGWTNQSYIDLGSIRREPYEAWEGCTLMQFTGLYDCEGKEIWEGDVLEIWIENIKQDNRYTVEDLRELYFEMNRDDSYYRINQIKVLGNLYEHPNSLNEEIKD